MYACVRASEAALAGERLRSQDGNRQAGGAGLGVLGPRGEQLEEMSCGLLGAVRVVMRCVVAVRAGRAADAVEWSRSFLRRPSS